MLQYFATRPLLLALVLIAVLVLVLILVLVLTLILIVALVLILVVHGTTSNFLLRLAAPLAFPRI